MRKLIGMMLIAGVIGFTACGGGGGNRDGRNVGDTETNDTIYLLDNDSLVPATGTPGSQLQRGTPATQGDGSPELRQGEVRDPQTTRTRRGTSDTISGTVPQRRGTTTDETKQDTVQQQVPRRRGS
jgi:hypothetical protein